MEFVKNISKLCKLDNIPEVVISKQTLSQKLTIRVSNVSFRLVAWLDFELK